MEFKGIKGEWVKEYSNCTTQIRCNDRLVCEVYHLFDIYNDDKDEYNATLIASAPKLLEALQDLVSAIESEKIILAEEYENAKQVIKQALSYDL